MMRVPRRLTHAIGLVTGLALACGPFRGHRPTIALEPELGRVTRAGRDGVWIDLGARQGIEQGGALWVWPSTASPPFTTPPVARLRVERVQDDQARCRLVEGSPRSARHGWVVWTGDGLRGPAGTRLSVPAPERLPDPTGWPTGGPSYRAGGGHLSLDRISLLAYEPLVREDRHGLLPGAARSWDVDGDGRTWRFELRADRRWSRGAALSAATAAQALAEALETEPRSLAAALLAAPPAVEGETLRLSTRAPVADFPRFLVPPELALRSPAGGTGPYRQLLDPPADAPDSDSGILRFERVRAARGPARLAVVSGDPTVNFHLGLVHVWRGIRAAAPVTEFRVGMPGARRGLGHAADGELWVLLGVDPSVWAAHHPLAAWVEALDRAALLRTYLGEGDVVRHLAELVTGAAPGGAPDSARGQGRRPRSGDARGATAGPPAPDGAPGQERPAPAGAAAGPVRGLRIVIPTTMPGPLVRLGERLQALLIQSGFAATLARGEPEGAPGPDRLVIFATSPRTRDPTLRLWDLVNTFGWRNRAAVSGLRDAIVVAAETGDPEAVDAASARVARELGLAAMARVPVQLWLRPEVQGGRQGWRWPGLWVEDEDHASRHQPPPGATRDPARRSAR